MSTTKLTTLDVMMKDIEANPFDHALKGIVADFVEDDDPILAKGLRWCMENQKHPWKYSARMTREWAWYDLRYKTYTIGDSEKDLKFKLCVISLPIFDESLLCDYCQQFRTVMNAFRWIGEQL